MRTSRALAALGCVVAVLLAGCGSDDPPPVHEYEKAPVPHDRDRAAVLASLSRIDACAMLKAAARGLPALGGQPKLSAKSPHSCLIKSRKHDFMVSVAVGVRFSPSARFYQDRIELGGAVAYVNQDPTSTDCGLAKYTIPTSFATAVQVFVSEVENCGDARKIAERVAGSLDDRTGAQPEWDACTALDVAVQKDRDHTVLPVESNGYGIDACGLEPRDPPALALRPLGTTMTLNYGRDPVKDADVADRSTIAGHPVAINARECRVQWSQGRWSAAPDPIVSARRFDLQRPGDCTAEAMTALKANTRSLITTLEGNPPRRAPLPQVTYRPGEPDIAKAGACVDYSHNASCEPYHRASIPEDQDDRLSVAARDGNVVCAMAADTVRKRLGRQFRPVTTSHRKNVCVFVEPAHSVEVVVDVSTDPVDQSGLYPGTESTVAGHPAQSGEEIGGVDRAVAVSTSADADDEEAGHLTVGAEVLETRAGSRPDPGQHAALPPLAGDIVSRYFR